MISKIKAKLSSDIHLTELLKGSTISFFFRIFGMGLGYVLTIMIARWYGAETLGLFVLSLTLLNIFATLAVFGFDNALVKLIAEFISTEKHTLVNEICKKSLIVTFFIGVLLSVVFFLSSIVFAKEFFQNEKLVIFFKIMSFGIVPLSIIRICSAVFRGFQDIIRYSFLENVAVYLLATIFLAIEFFVFHKLNPNTTIIIYVACLMIFMLICFFMAQGLKSEAFKIDIKQKGLNFKKIIKVSAPMLLTNSMAIVIQWTDIIMLGLFRSEVDVGIYSVVIKISGLANITLMSINSIAAPKFSSLYSRGDMNGLKNAVQSSTKMIFYSTLPIIMILTFFSSIILNFFGSDFIIGVTALWVLMFGQFINALTGPVGSLLNMTNKHVLFNKIILLCSALNIVLNYFMIQRYGITGASVATSISLILLNILPFFYVKYYYGFFSLNLLMKK